MSFDSMAPYNNKAITHIWDVSKSGLVPVRKHKVANETDKTFVLDDGTIVRKNTMQNNYVFFFTNEESANVVYRNLSSVFDPDWLEPKSNFDIIASATISDLPDILIDMINELGEDGMLSREGIKEWLLRAPGNEKHLVTSNMPSLEDYSSLKDGDTVYHVNVEANEIVQGVAYGVRRNTPDHSVRYLSIIAPNDFMGCAGELLGDIIFISKELAEKRLKEGRKNV